MPAPTITELPDPPLRSQSPPTFSGIAEAFVLALVLFVTELNAFIAYLNSLGLDPGDSLLAENNLSDVGDAAIARANIGANIRCASFQIVGSAPTASELLMAWTPPAGESVTFADDFDGSAYKKVSTGSNPATTYAMDVKLNGSSVGSIAISAAGAVTFSTSGTTVTVVGGTDVLEVFGSASIDAGALGYTFTLAGTF